MECVDHPGVEPVARCVSCGKYLCAECTIDRGRIYCARCDPGPAASGETPGECVQSMEPSPWLQGLEPGKAFAFVLDDPGWLPNFLVGVLLLVGSFLIVPFLIVMGYMLEMVRQVAYGDDRCLPSWQDWGKKLKEGTLLTVLLLLYAIPLYIVLGGTITLGTLTGGVHGPALVFAVLLFALGWLVTIVVGLILLMLFPALAERYALTGSVKESLRPVMAMRLVEQRFQQRMVVAATIIMVFWFLVPIGFIACCVGVFVTGYYGLLVAAHLTGQLARPDVEGAPEGGSADD